MFLSTLFRKSVSITTADNVTPFYKAAIRAELDYLAGVDCRQIDLDMSGDYVVVEGIAFSHGDLARIIETATEIAGANRVICRAVICPTAA